MSGAFAGAVCCCILISGMAADYDICIVGGGVNGAGIARDAAGRGLKTLLVEAQDLASATSSSSTKLIHGGLRYLEHFEFKLVRESLIEREILLHNAPHIIWPLDFVLPHKNSVRPAWMIRLGLYLYDHLGGRKILKGSRGVLFNREGFGSALKPVIRKGFSYQDCWVEDSRLVALNAFDASRLGADVKTYTACTGVHVEGEDRWRIGLQDMLSGEESSLTAKAVINATGPWVRGFLEASGLIDQDHPAPGVRMVKGSHIITRRLYDGDHAYILQQPDKRIVFAIPYERHFTLIGTTDVEYNGNPSDAGCSDEEVEYLCNAINIYFDQAISFPDVLWSYSGVRPLIDDGTGNASKVTRDYKLHLDEGFGPPLLSVFGGKITTYRTLSEHVMDKVAPLLSCSKPAWTQQSPLPGGKVPAESIESFINAQVQQYSWLPEDVVRRYARAYGARMNKILGHATSPEQLGRDFGGGVYEAELVYSIHYEFTKTLEDFLWRRTNLGLHLAPAVIDKLEAAFPSIYNEVRKL